MARMGLTVDCFPFGRKGAAALDLLDYCHSFGAGGVEAPLGSLEAGYARKVRERAEKLGLYLEVWATLPREDAVEFERTVVAAKQAGATRLRAFCLGGRRYEVFTTLEDWKRFVVESRGRIQRALPILEKHRLPLGLENHKDWTTEEMLALMKEFGGDYLGVCLDVGNNISFLDDVIEMVESLAPFTIATHMKDMAVEEYEEGFLLVEAPFGDGMLDVKRIVETVRKARPDASFTLEMMTRSPLKIPCLTPKYWVTFPDRGGDRLARALRLVRANKPRQPLPQVEGLAPAARVKLEEDNVRRCLDYARQHLGL
jgi:sugar phosphate isomerase/epimerase